ncbi:HAD-like domain-containing protein [Neohortaea acidophila]|uniref:HAD-like domain-containing protein n=1 Tax=Neohortaea acidophila TaxID=245834 RepID=A0A6A6PM06_9PEZI|nr:HAD-like domain-containing protein [Neohortaea acidophila]KAF2480297.1 HAD-like domain-containing protein [Neohortaea acidophila]
MNSLNIVSRFTAAPPTATPPRSRTGSAAEVGLEDDSGREGQSSGDDQTAHPSDTVEEDGVTQEDYSETKIKVEDADEKTPLRSHEDHSGFKPRPGSHVWDLPYRIAHAIFRGVQALLSTIGAPGRYIIACFYDQQGHFSPVLPFRNLTSLASRRRRKSAAQAVGIGAAASSSEKLDRKRSSKRSTSVDSQNSSSTLGSSDGEGEHDGREDSPARHTRSRTAAAAQQDEAPLRKSIQIKPQTDEALRKRRAAKALQRKAGASAEDVEAVAAALKSPSSPSTASARLTRYPRAPAPPRPLVPRRQPSYTLSYSTETPKKTLIIDLDETLIHSLAKGGRMSTGHMVEVRLGGPVPTSQPGTAGPSNVSIGHGVPILYYVHERPGCHEFLRKVSKWYNLIVFTASVQEYADPVIDWLERERRYFGGRYYRQHCTLRNGAYIKDLAQVEPDLSRVMILDNSPMSYIFHEDNAIPIEGWISDPTDNDLLHLIPLLEGLQYVTDVRALLALRQGQAQQA